MFFRGVFAGLTISIVGEEAGITSSYSDDDELEISKTDLAFGLQLGKVWSISESWSVGLGWKGTLDGGVRDGDNSNNSDSFSLAANLIVMRK